MYVKRACRERRQEGKTNKRGENTFMACGVHMPQRHEGTAIVLTGERSQATGSAPEIEEHWSVDGRALAAERFRPVLL